MVLFRLDDLSRAAYHSNIITQRLLSGIFLELVFAKEIRDELASMNTPGMIRLSQRSNNVNQQIKR